ncbi:MAG TPA: DEAD/DEAH box helicase [bacterium]|nr:DEAD/DEAH box helicase [bacterium]
MLFKGYELDPFQEQAINALDKGHSIIVAAPTGAGKTVIAEYAIEKAIQEGKQIIYTAPIKALSNQKFRDFSSDYPDKIGIMTGDVIINPEAPVLIMTTEIFRNIIFEAEETRLENIYTVIFDEIHYINDIQRGTVWEESIIFAPQHIRFICLSATIPNFEEFAAWMRSVRDIEIQTISESNRPVPLKVHLWVPGYGFRNISFLKQLEKEDLSRRKKQKGGNIDLVKILKEEDKLPCLYFHFSRMGCEEYAQYFRGMNLLTNKERRNSMRLFDKYAEQFGVEIKGQALFMRNLLKGGVAFHHAGVLPAIKEIIERLYTLGLIKLLFTTETFAVGINMPAKSVIFDNLLKHDGITFRFLTAREFQQMAGRAGRRGIDEVGNAYACIDLRDISYEGVRQTLSKDAEDIESQFSLSYSSILNLYNNFGDGIYEVCEKSFNNFKSIGQLEQFNGQADRIGKSIEELKSRKCHRGGTIHEKIARFLDLRNEFFKLKNNLRQKSSKKSMRFKYTERITQVKNEIESLDCSHCKNLKNCRKTAVKIKALQREIRDIGDLRFEAENSQRELLKRRLEFLERLGYIDKNGLLPRGLIASQIFGYEIQFTELYFDGVFEELTEEQINVLVASIVFEARRGVKSRKTNDPFLDKTIRHADRTIMKLKEYERESHVPSLIKALDPKLNKVVLEWSRGCKFEDLKSFASIDDGDFVRSFRLIVDFLRQMKRAINSPAFRDKMDRCVKLIYRDVVDAESQLQTDLEVAN